MSQQTIFLTWLEQQYNTVMQHEQDALAALQNNDVALYNQGMEAKAAALAALAHDATSYLEGHPEASSIRTQLRLFSESAQRALDLNSHFYMAALLYPDEYTPNQPNALARFIAELKKNKVE